MLWRRFTALLALLLLAQFSWAGSQLACAAEPEHHPADDAPAASVVHGGEHAAHAAHGAQPSTPAQPEGCDLGDMMLHCPTMASCLGAVVLPQVVTTLAPVAVTEADFAFVASAVPSPFPSPALPPPRA